MSTPSERRAGMIARAADDADFRAMVGDAAGLAPESMTKRELVEENARLRAALVEAQRALARVGGYHDAEDVIDRALAEHEAHR